MVSSKVTMQRIADYVGVSKYVVSKTLSGKKGVSKETRKRVLKAAAELGYVAPQKPNTGVKNIEDTASPKAEDRSDKNMYLVIMQNVHVQTKESPFWGEIIDGISSTVDKKGCKMVLLTEINTGSIQRVVHLSEFAGVITVGYISTNILIEIMNDGLPLVMIDHEDSLIPCDTIFSNNYDASFQLTNYLIGLGHQRIQFVGDIHYSRSFYERFSGVRDCLKDKDMDNDFDERLTNIKGNNFYDEFNSWTSSQSEDTFPSAFICANDQIARTVIDLLTEGGYQVPADVSVTGFDNTTFSYTASPTITTVNVARKEMGKRSVEILMKRIQEKDASLEKTMLIGHMIHRESTAPVK